MRLQRIARPDADYVRAATGFVIGGVPPVAHERAIRTLIDTDLLALDPIWAAAGTPVAVFRLSAAELVSQANGLLIAGFETTIGLIGNGVRALLRHPAELAKLRADPGLLASAVDECLRWDGPIVLTARVLHADAEFGGKTIPKNAMVWGMLAAADRDPEAFPDPDRFDVARRPNDHLAFGGGPHYCLGAHLARIEGELAIGGLAQRFDDLALESETVEWGASLFRVPGRLPITFRA